MIVLTSAVRSGVSRPDRRCKIPVAARHGEIIRCRRHATPHQSSDCSGHRLRGLHSTSGPIPPAGRTLRFRSLSGKRDAADYSRALSFGRSSSSGADPLPRANPQARARRRPPATAFPKRKPVPSESDSQICRIELRCISRAVRPALAMRPGR